MITENIQNKTTELRQLLEKYNKAYIAGEPLISDTEYDKLYQELTEIETQYPELVTPDSPTQQVDKEYEIVDGLKTVIHKKPVLSLEKAHSEDDLKAFVRRIEKISANFALEVQDKYDGLTLVLDYNGGKLIDAVTRGQGGIKGERVLHTAKQIKSIPKKIKYKGYIKIRGEAYMLKSVFNKINCNGEKATARNSASGLLRSLDSKAIAENPLEFTAYEVIESDEEFITNTDEDIISDSYAIEFLKKQGFQVPSCRIFTTADDNLMHYPADYSLVDDLYEYIIDYGKNTRNTLPYDIDGMVIKVADLSMREKLGTTSHHPKWGIAFKFESENATTTLRSVEIATNRTGQISYTAVFDPLEITGSTISRATLNNEDFINALNLKIGDKILVAKANDVIPKVIKSFPELRTGTETVIPLPKICPVCKSPLIKDGAHKFCTNPLCSAQKEEKIIHFAANGAMEIEGLGENIVKQLSSIGLLNSITDIYTLKDKTEKLLTIDGFGAKRVQKLLANIEASKSRPLVNVLYALSIRYVGEGTSKRLCKIYNSMREILFDADNVSEDQRLTPGDPFVNKLAGIPDIGINTAVSLAKFFYSQEGQSLIKQLMTYGLKMKEPDNTISDTLKGLTVVVTGTLPTLSRKEAESLIEAHGGKASGSVSKKTSFVLYGENAGSKLTKAKALHVPCLNESEFLAKIS